MLVMVSEAPILLTGIPAVFMSVQGEAPKYQSAVCTLDLIQSKAGTKISHTKGLWQWVANSVQKELILLLGLVPFALWYAPKTLLMNLVVGPIGRVGRGGRNWEGRLLQSILPCSDPVVIHFYRIFEWSISMWFSRIRDCTWYTAERSDH